MANGFSVTNPSTGASVFSVDNSGNINTSGSLNVGGAANLGGQVTMGGSVSNAQVFGPGAGTNTGGAATSISSPFTVGTAPVLVSSTLDAMCYITIGTPGTAAVLTMGPTTAGTSYTVYTSGTPTTRTLITWRQPAGWYSVFNGSSTTITNQLAITC